MVVRAVGIAMRTRVECGAIGIEVKLSVDYVSAKVHDARSWGSSELDSGECAVGLRHRSVEMSHRDGSTTALTSKGP